MRRRSTRSRFRRRRVSACSRTTARSVLVEPAGRRRAVLMIEGAPGFEHSFIKRALAADPGLEVDSVVRKGRDATGAATYFVQASEARAPRLAAGFPQEREALYEYDALVLANVEADALSRRAAPDDCGLRRTSAAAACSCSGRSRSSSRDSPARRSRACFPLRLTDRGGGVVRVSARQDTRYAVTLTADGASHPVMRLGAGAGGRSDGRRCRRCPAQRRSATLRPGAQALALVRTPDGARPLVAVQRYGQGRSMVFTGEASWRWRMQMPSDGPHLRAVLAAGRALDRRRRPRPRVDRRPRGPRARQHRRAQRRRARRRVRAGHRRAGVVEGDASGRSSPRSPGRRVRPAVGTLFGRHAVRRAWRVPRERLGSGGRHPRPECRIAGSSSAARTWRWPIPASTTQVLQRIATASGGQYLAADRTSELAALLRSVEPEASAPQLQELWHNIWIFVAVMMLLGAEWVTAPALGVAVKHSSTPKPKSQWPRRFGRWRLGFGF